MIYLDEMVGCLCLGKRLVIERVDEVRQIPDSDGAVLRPSGDIVGCLWHHLPHMNPWTSHRDPMSILPLDGLPSRGG